jgi:hypothetical protein
LPLIAAKNRRDFADENPARDSGGEDQSIGNPVTHFSSVDKRCRLEKLLNDKNGYRVRLTIDGRLRVKVCPNPK